MRLTFPWFWGIFVTLHCSLSQCAHGTGYKMAYFPPEPGALQGTARESGGGFERFIFRHKLPTQNAICMLSCYGSVSHEEHVLVVKAKGNWICHRMASHRISLD